MKTDALRARLSRRRRFGRHMPIRVYSRRLRLLVGGVGLLWVIEFADRFLIPTNFEQYGTRPGNWNHWEGTFAAALLHTDWAHLAANSVPLLIMGTLILLHGHNRPFTVALAATIGDGLLVMYAGDPNSVHVGASGIVYGYVFYLVAYSIKRKTPIPVVTAIVTASLYGYANFLIGMLPIAENLLGTNLSWEGHLGGAIGGLVAGWRLR